MFEDWSCFPSDLKSTPREDVGYSFFLLHKKIEFVYNEPVRERFLMGHKNLFKARHGN